MSHQCHLSARICLILGLSLLLGSAAPASAAEHWLGVGAHFWKTVDDLAGDGFDDIEEDGFAVMVNYTYQPRGLFFLQIDVEYHPDGFGGSRDSAIVPTAFAGIGSGWYAAVGIGSTFASDLQDNMSDPFYSGRIGRRFDVLGRVGADIHLNYRADAFDELENASTDAITIGATIRFNL